MLVSTPSHSKSVFEKTISRPEFLFPLLMGGISSLRQKLGKMARTQASSITSLPGRSDIMFVSPQRLILNHIVFTVAICPYKNENVIMIFSVHTSTIYARGNTPFIVLPNQVMHAPLITLESLHDLVYAWKNESEHSSSTRSSSHCHPTNHFGRVLIFIEISNVLYVLQRNGKGS